MTYERTIRNKFCYGHYDIQQYDLNGEKIIKKCCNCSLKFSCITLTQSRYIKDKNKRLAKRRHKKIQISTHE